MKLGRNFSRGGLFLVVYGWGCPESLAEVAVRSGTEYCTGFCMDGTGKLAVTRVGREVQVHSSPEGSLFWYVSLIVIFPFGSFTAELR